MAKILYVCFREPYVPNEIETEIVSIMNNITPDNIVPKPPKTFYEKGTAYGIMNHVSSIREHEGSVAMGTLYEPADDWWMPLKSFPNGSFALFRQNSENIELVTDIVASRTIWYYKGEKMFVASTSQRAIVMLLKDFRFNKAVIPWILSTGSLGPDHSWDLRIRQVPQDSSIILDRKSWNLQLSSRKSFDNLKNTDDQDFRGLLLKSMVSTFESIKLDFKKWVLPLSGGYDSRAILVMLNYVKQNTRDLKTITWGLKDRRKKKGNDAYVAKKLADHFGISNKYYTTDRSLEPIGTIFHRFFVCGEGRIDNIGGYMDGFKMWKSLYEDGIEGIIRGDVGFTSKPAENVHLVRFRQGLTLCSDYSNLKNYQQFGIPKQVIPEQLNKKEIEDLRQWRDRIYQEFRIPVVLAALSDLKLSYVELINPLLSREIVTQGRRLPQKFKDEKRLFKEITSDVSPHIEIARVGATEDLGALFRSKEVIDLFQMEFKKPSIARLIHEEFLKNISTKLNFKDKPNTIRRQVKIYLKRFLPNWVTSKFLLINSSSPSINFNLLAFRIYTISQMNEMLTKDAVFLDERRKYNKVI